MALVGAFACVFAFQGYMTARPWAFQMDKDQTLYDATGRLPGAVLAEVVLAVVVIAACDGFIPVAERLTEYENHRTDSLFENHLIGKVFVFHFIASYAPFFYLALGRDFMPGATRDRKWGCSPGSDGCFRLCGNQIFNQTSMCAYATVSTRALLPCFENSTRAIDSSQNQPNRFRFDRAREF